MSDEIEALFEEEEKQNIKRRREENDRPSRRYSRDRDSDYDRENSRESRRDYDRRDSYYRERRRDRRGSRSPSPSRERGRERRDRSMSRDYDREDERQSGKKRSRSYKNRYDEFRKDSVEELPLKKKFEDEEKEEYKRKRQKISEDGISSTILPLPSTLPTIESESIPKDEKGTQTQRTVFVYRLNSMAREEEVRNFFQRAGKVRDVKLIKDKATGMSKGFGYIEFDDISSVGVALGMHGQDLQGSPVCVKQVNVNTHVEKQVKKTKSKKEVSRLYVTNFPNILDEKDIELLFDSLGNVETVEMKKSEKNKKYCYVTYRNTYDAPKALLRLNGVNLGLGMNLRVGMWNEEYAKKGQRNEQHMLTLDGGSNGIKLSSDARANLMKKIAGGAMKDVTIETDEKEEKKIDNVIQRKSMASMPTKNILLRNMFDIKKKNDFEEIFEDVKRVVSKYGDLLHIFIDEKSVLGEIYLRYQSITEASTARQNVKDRTFDKKKIEVIFIEDSEFFKAMERVKNQ